LPGRATGTLPDPRGELLLRDSTYGASLSAGTAVCALVSVDDIDGIAHLDAANRAGISASAASQTIVMNNVSHYVPPLN